MNRSMIRYSVQVPLNRGSVSPDVPLVVRRYDLSEPASVSCLILLTHIGATMALSYIGAITVFSQTKGLSHLC